MSDAFGALFGGNRGAHHLRGADEAAGQARNFIKRVRDLASGLADGEALFASSIEQLVARYKLAIVNCAMYGSNAPADGELAMELGGVEDDDPQGPRALVLLKEDARAQMASGRVFILDREFEVSK